MRVVDWRGEPAEVIAPLLSAEARIWAADLDWDVGAAWQPIEPARAAGHLPGFIARDGSGRIRGWSCFLVHRGALQVAMLVADAADVTAALVDAIDQSSEAACAVVRTVCVRAGAPALDVVLAARGLSVATYRYLAAPVASLTIVPRPPVYAWRPDDGEALAALCRRAYRDATDVRAFAPLDTPAEWHEYVTGLVAGVGCGRLMPDASFTCRARDGRQLDAAILTTRLNASTAHVAQLVVDPSVRGRGVAPALIAAAMDAVRHAGCCCVTLLVAEGNQRAAGIYDRVGFRDRASFVVAASAQPRRVSSVALATGGASTRR